MDHECPRPACSPEKWPADNQSGAVRALWPEIQQALQSGQTLKTVRDWLEAEGVSLQIQPARDVRRQASPETGSSLRSASPRRTGRASLRFGPKTTRPLSEPGPAARDPLANLRSREGRPRTFEYNPEFKEEELL